MADFAVYWSWYRNESGIDGEPITNWLTNRTSFARGLERGDRFWLFVGGDACGETKTPRQGYLAEVFVVDDVEETPDDEMKFNVWGDETQCFLVNPPKLIDSILRKPGSDPALHIGIARQTPMKLNKPQVEELMAIWHSESPITELQFPEEIPTGSVYREGSVERVVINRYERDDRARRDCIEHYGKDCFVCGFNFGAVYGPLAHDIIHVHHLKLLSEIGDDYEVDPVADLRPVCPNCHAVIHWHRGCRSIEEVRQMLK